MNFNINKIPIILLLLVFVLNFGHSYKSTENYLYAGTYSGSVIDEFFESFKQNESKQPSGIEDKKIADILSAQPGIKDSVVMGGNHIIAHYVNSKKYFGASFQEEPENDTVENYITRKNWSEWDLFLINMISKPANLMNTDKSLPDYLIYTPNDGVRPLTQRTHNKIQKILSDPTNPEIPDNFKVIYHSNKTGMVIYKIDQGDNNKLKQ